MKKTLALILSLLALSVTSGFAQTTFDFGGAFGAIGQYNTTDSAAKGNLGKARFWTNASVGDYTSVYLEFRNDTFDGGAQNSFNIQEFYGKLDVFGALGIDGVGMNLTTGYFEHWDTHWHSATSANRARAVESDWVIGATTTFGAAAIDFTVAGMTLDIYYAPLNSAGYNFNALKIALGSGSLVEGLDFMVSYSTADVPNTDPSKVIEKGYLKAEAGITAGMVYVPVTLLYELDKEYFHYGTGVKFSNIADLMNINLGLSGKLGDTVTDQELDVLDLELYFNVFKGTAIPDSALYAKVYTSPTNPEYDFLQSIDLGARFNVDAVKIYAGFVIGMEKKSTGYYTTKVAEDDSDGRYGVTGSGAYVAAQFNF
jgi:hypothetical protein